MDGNGEVEVDAGATLAAVFADLAAEFPDVVRADSADGVTYEVAGRAFAILKGSRSEFRLRPEIAAAAARTPDAHASPRGPEWVAFVPRTFDQHALDRAQAWFELGHRLAADAARRH